MTMGQKDGFLYESGRLGFRRFTEADFPAVCGFLQDPEVMAAWEHGFSDAQARQWLQGNLARYARDGFGYFAAIEKQTGRLIGAMGPLVEEIDGEAHIGIAYIVSRDCWGKGYGAEGAGACLHYAFSQLRAKRVIAQIRPENIHSRWVAEALGMREAGQFVKMYQGKEMPHLIYEKENGE